MNLKNCWCVSHMTMFFSFIRRVKISVCFYTCMVLMCFCVVFVKHCKIVHSNHFSTQNVQGSCYFYKYMKIFWLIEIVWLCQLIYLLNCFVLCISSILCIIVCVLCLFLLKFEHCWSVNLSISLWNWKYMIER